jgi:hypothetical protein
MPGWLPDKTRRALKTLAQLPKRQTLNYLQYRLAIDSGWLKFQTRSPQPPDPAVLQPALPLFVLPEPAHLAGLLGPQGLANLEQEADEIVAGTIRLFGGPPVPLQLEPPPPGRHWTDLERGRYDLDYPEDIKLVWEPARFGWAVTLARAAYLLDKIEYQRTFWQFTRRFLEANPANTGWNWTSAQEVALRLIALTFALHVFQRAPAGQGQEMGDLLAALAAHAERLPISLAYARAQNNNHLLSEAAGLYTAGCLLPDHPQAARWRRLGWRVFHQALQQQIAPDGVYIQHSSNYTRLMLQLALWVRLLADGQQQPFPSLSQERLAQATRWLLYLVDTTTGQTPNLGPNDGGSLLALTSQPFNDYRPVLQAAGQAFLHQAPFPAGPWDELASWLVVPPAEPGAAAVLHSLAAHTLRHPQVDTWVYLRAARFTSRPGHADQLHLDLWWNGYNLAQDPGTYSYNAAPPWDNTLVHTTVHNTLCLNEQDQMTPAGRFLFLDWAQAEILEYSPPGPLSSGRIVARHDGYHHLGWEHQRSVKLLPGGDWRVTDRLLPVSGRSSLPAEARLHWLLPDWPWELVLEDHNVLLSLQSPAGQIRLQVAANLISPTESATTLRPALFRAGECLYGRLPAQPTWGWSSPTYHVRRPALALTCTLEGLPPIGFETNFWLPQSGTV